MTSPVPLSILLPAHNETAGLPVVVEGLRRVLGAEHPEDHEIIVVDDASTDNTAQVAAGLGLRLIRHPVQAGYGASLKTGIEAAQFPYVAILDADGTYRPEDLASLRVEMAGLDMIVGARQGAVYRGGGLKPFARWCFKTLGEFVTGMPIPDINSGLRIFRRAAVRPCLHEIGNGFSFTTTITLLFLLNGYFVKYLPVAYQPRVGSSKVRAFRDTLRALQVLVEIIVRYNPIKLFLLIAVPMFVFGLIEVLVGKVLPCGDCFALGVMWLPTSVLVFCIGLLAAVFKAPRRRVLEGEATRQGS